MEQEPTYGEEVRKYELIALRNSSGLDPKSPEFAEYVAVYDRGEMVNTAAMYRGLVTLVEKLSQGDGMRFCAVPFFEASWLLTGSGPGLASFGDVVSRLLAAFDKATSGNLPDRYTEYFQVLPAEQVLNRRTFVQWIEASRQGEPLQQVRVEAYRKLIRMLALVSKRYKFLPNLWTDVAASLCPAWAANLVTLPAEKVGNQPIRVATVGDVGNGDPPVLMPFVTVNRQGLYFFVLQALKESKAVAFRRSGLPLPAVQAALYVTYRHSETDYGGYPALELRRLLNVVEARRRRQF